MITQINLLLTILLRYMTVYNILLKSFGFRVHSQRLISRFLWFVHHHLASHCKVLNTIHKDISSFSPYMNHSVLSFYLSHVIAPRLLNFIFGPPLITALHIHIMLSLAHFTLFPSSELLKCR